MARTKKQKFIVMTLNKKYLVYGELNRAKNAEKAWNTIRYFVKEERRATRFDEEREAAMAIQIMNTYLHGSVLLATKEIWE